MRRTSATYVVMTVFILLIVGVRSRAQAPDCKSAPAHCTEPGACTPPDPGSSGTLPIDFEWSCAQLHCRFFPMVAAADAADVRDTDWNWGDGNTVHRVNVEPVRYTYLQAQSYPRNYLVTLSARGFSGRVGTRSKVVTLEASALTAEFGYNDVSYGLTGSFWALPRAGQDATSHRFFWSWGDGTQDDNPSHTEVCKTYTHPGLYAVTLRVVRIFDGSSVSRTELVNIVNRAPLPAFRPLASGMSYSFDAASTTDEPATGVRLPSPPIPNDCLPQRNRERIVAYAWEYGDGALQSGASAQSAHTYETPGQYTVRLTTTDDHGALATTTRAIRVPDAPPSVTFDFNCAGLACTFDGAATRDDAAIESLSWSFGDGTPGASSATTSHTFAADGTYKVRLTATDGFNTPVTFTRTVTVVAQPLTEALRFFAPNPCLLYDSSALPNGLGAGQTADFPTGFLCNMGSTRAVAVVIRAWSATAAGHIDIFPRLEPQPLGQPGVLSFTPGRVSTTSTVVTLPSPGGWLSVRPVFTGGSGSVHVSVQASGYFSSETVGWPGVAGPLYFATVTPCRAAATTNSGTPVPSDQAYNVPLRSVCGLPAHAYAAALDLDVAYNSAAGDLKLFPSDLTNASPLLSPPAPNSGGSTAVLMRLARKPAGDDVTFKFKTSVPASTHFFLDTTGYFAPYGAAFSYFPVKPCRIADTRDPDYGDPRLANSGTYDFQVQGNCGVPRGAGAALLRVSMLGPDSAGYVKFYAPDTAEGWFSSLEFGAADRAPSQMVISRLSSAQRDLRSRSYFMAGGTAGSHVVVDVVGYFGVD